MENEENKDTNEINKNNKLTTIILLLIIIIVYMLYTNGTFYKFKKITKDNINEIMYTEKLNEAQRSKIMIMYLLNKDSVIDKRIFEVLN